MLSGSPVIKYFLPIITQYCQNDMPRGSVEGRSKIYVGREEFSVPKHDKSVLHYTKFILCIILDYIK